VIESEAINGKYVGRVNEYSDGIEGFWFQNSMEFPLDLVRGDGTVEIKRPQEPKAPFPYKVEEVSFKSRDGDVVLAATLTLPENGTGFPAVLLITGSGPQDRNEEIMGHKPFLLIADWLTRQGIAVLRYDDRGFGDSTGDLVNATTGDFELDALGGIDFLLNDERIDPGRLGIIGHSEGAMIAAMMAAGSPDIACIVMMAGPGLSGMETLVLQSQKLLQKNGASQEYIEEVTGLNEKLYQIAVEEDDPAKAEKKIRKAFDKYTKGMSDQEKAQQGFNEAMVKGAISELLNPWMKYFLSLDIKEYLVEVACPVLVLNGDKDLQVPPAENVPLIESALARGGNKQVKAVVFPGLNHLFQTALSGRPEEYGTIEETIAPVVLEEISNWLGNNFAE
jgi:pimeloyl-ACP methyl ester carboxylesterase